MFSKNTEYTLKFISKAAFFLFASSYINCYLFLQNSYENKISLIVSKCINFQTIL